jgi:hypothetical protein
VELTFRLCHELGVENQSNSYRRSHGRGQFVKKLLGDHANLLEQAKVEAMEAIP